MSPVLAGDIYCSVLEACQETFDLRRAYEWTTSLAEWCAAQPDLVRYRGECLLYRAEILQLRGDWTDAAHDAQEACELLSRRTRPAAGAAFYRVGEIHRLRGEFAKAEDSVHGRRTSADESHNPGCRCFVWRRARSTPRPRRSAASLPDTARRDARARMLAAAVEILLAAGDLETARAAADRVVARSRAPLARRFLAAASAHADRRRPPRRR